jgi:hypothetical protein
MIQAVAPASAAFRVHDHAWHRDNYDIDTKILKYACGLCPTTWAGARRTLARTRR